jgi:diguanylate cyclase (GGDEF)-like protein
MQKSVPYANDLDLVGIMSEIEETAYRWNIDSDHLEWESNANSVLGFSEAASIDTGRALEALITPEHLARRRQAILGAVSTATERGVPFRIQYKLLPGGPRTNVAIWLEETGRCWPGSDGNPAHARGVVRVINDGYWEEQRLLELSDHDELTGLLNRVRLIEALGGVIGRAERTRQQCAFLIVAVNNLNVINETFGFDVGDEVIAVVARLLKEKLRGGDAIGRYSSNKFGVILNECGLSAMRTAADRFIASVRDARIVTSACPLAATISVGGIMLPEQARSPQQAVSHALIALDHTRQTRSEQFSAYKRGAQGETLRQRSISVADNVISALDEDRMQFVLQPMVSAQTGQPELYECLLRMVCADGSLTSAGEFIPIAEQLGLSRLIDRRTLDLSLSLLKRHPALKLSLNVSGLTAEDPDWIAALKKEAAADSTLASRLIVEITETAAIHDLDRTADYVDALRKLGCRVAIDDFGAGYTSFKNLKALNVDMVKIDGAFVKDVLSDVSGQVFIKSLVQIAETFQMETVAEWVGDAETATCMRQAGITYLQGFYYGLPLTVAEFEAGYTDRLAS